MLHQKRWERRVGHSCWGACWLASDKKTWKISIVCLSVVTVNVRGMRPEHVHSTALFSPAPGGIRGCFPLSSSSGTPLSVPPKSGACARTPCYPRRSLLFRMESRATIPHRRTIIMIQGVRYEVAGVPLAKKKRKGVSWGVTVSKGRAWRVFFRPSLNESCYGNEPPRGFQTSSTLRAPGSLEVFVFFKENRSNAICPPPRPARSY